MFYVIISMDRMIIFILMLMCFTRASFQRLEASPFPADSHYTMNINMPDVKPLTSDSYLCTARQIDPREAYIVKYEPDVSGTGVHHILLFGCKDMPNLNHMYPKHWDCGQGDICRGMAIIYGWARNAPSMELPPDVGFLVGGNSSIHYIVLQMHYANPLPVGVTDNSGLKLHLTSQRQRYITGIRLLLNDRAQIPPRTPLYHVDVNCKYDENYSIYPFAFRVHAHKLGVVITGYAYNTVTGNWTLLAKGNPQWPQAFYPIPGKNTINRDTILAARCTYNSSSMNFPVNIGSTAEDEMCNLYLMYYTDWANAEWGQSPPCIGTQFARFTDSLPPGNDVPLPLNPELEQRASAHPHHSVQESVPAGPVAGHALPPFYPNKPGNALDNEYLYKEDAGWPAPGLKLGQVAAVAMDRDGHPVIFHRGDHVWNELSFDEYHNYLQGEEGPIEAATVIVLHPKTGVPLTKLGQNFFYMPHGLFIDYDGSYWMTDVAMHQVFHFGKSDLKKPVLTLGEKFVPGTDNGHFCKPTSVAVAKDGDIYIADGYCNSRIMRFSKDGSFSGQWGKQDNVFERKPPVGTFRIPHKIVLLEDRNLVCVADRENGRIQCFTMDTGRFRFQIEREEFGGTLYSIAYAKDAGVLFAVCGEAVYRDHKVRAFAFNVTSQRLLNVFAPRSETFTRPHDIAVTSNAEFSYVCEIGPNLVWKFFRVYHTSTHLPEPQQTVKTAVLKSKTDVAKTPLEDESTAFETSLIILCLLAIPVLCLVLVTVFLRLSRRGALQQSYFGNLKGWWGGYKTPHPTDKFNLGSLLNPHKGFDRVSMEESDAEGEENSDSDVEEFSAIAKKT